MISYQNYDTILAQGSRCPSLRLAGAAVTGRGHGHGPLQRGGVGGLGSRDAVTACTRRAASAGGCATDTVLAQWAEDSGVGDLSLSLSRRGRR